ncbi:MAG: hypothetical protein ABI925_02470 [Verrucomicrobiota bacterium]
MNPSEPQAKSSAEQVPKVALVFMLLIVVGLALVSVYANVQRLRRDKIESVTITPAASPSPFAP